MEPTTHIAAARCRHCKRLVMSRDATTCVRCGAPVPPAGSTSLLDRVRKPAAIGLMLIVGVSLIMTELNSPATTTLAVCLPLAAAWLAMTVWLFGADQ